MNFSLLDSATCDVGWAAYKDELCIKLFDSLVTYDDAQYICSAQGSRMSKSSLVMVKKAEMQELLGNYTKETYDNVWLGGKYDEEAAEFKWADGDALTFTNWNEGFPRNTSDSDTCIQLRPVNAKTTDDLDGKWEDTQCQRRNLAVCQKDVSWTLQDAVDVILNLREELRLTREDVRLSKEEIRVTQQDLRGSQEELRVTKEGLAATKRDLVDVSGRVVPVGSLYIEYFNQPSPRSLWPNFTWVDVSSQYAGQFFRVTGGSASSFGTVQSECSPRITSTHYARIYTWPTPVSIPSNDWSGYIYSGNGGNGGDVYGIRFLTAGCEVRPVNQAVKIWKRSS